MNYILLFGMPGGAEIIIILLVIIMFFGADKIPEFARMLGKGIREIKSATNEIQKEIKDSASPITDVTDKIDIKKQVKKMMAENVDHAPSNKEVIEEKEEVVSDEKSTAALAEEESSTTSKTVARKSPYDKVKEIPKEENE